MFRIALGKLFSNCVPPSRTFIRGRQQFIGPVVVTMPRQRVSKGEKIVLTCMLFGPWLPYPLWVMWNFEHYKQPPE